MKKERSNNEEGKEAGKFPLPDEMGYETEYVEQLKLIGETSYETSIQSFGSG